MKSRSVLIKPASSLCQLSCKYCFYHDIANRRSKYSFGIMTKEIAEVIINKTLNGVDQVQFVFQGGEPTLAGLCFFKEFIRLVNIKINKNQTVYYSLQTNGYDISEEMVKFFAENNFLIGISLDGYKEIHNKYRINNCGGTFDKIQVTIKLLQKYKVKFNILSVLTQELSKHPERLYQFYKREGYNYVQLIPCLPPVGKSPYKNEYALTPQQFFSFYDKLFNIWIKDYQKGKTISFDFFDNVIPLFNGVPPQTCGMLGFCIPQYVIESNGNIYPCDFYCTDDYCLGNISDIELNDLSKSILLKKFIDEPRRLSSKCSNCEFNPLCKGNCKRLNVAYFNDDGYCGYYEFLNKNFKKIYNLALKLQSTR